ncbi:CDP-alcohol phosphatidyltransferase family protein [Schlegelella sp. S2-27]|uniref:CDP-alcohol phosphatidyltransferase family protein n=1 Tax=Caldimonas mangrovi TaxID=2944811 RepID=A0ABT0YVG9_9BURK|nr:CDP-alcohol phosphatidyltransferase family protein [Caldimonas mangrovi]MCM5681798.1 CDP-alcohol phosphatidyltransferase family protein [Caldimonas mangrovi]
MTLYQLKPAFQQRLRPWVGRLARHGVRANHVTLAAAALSIALGAWLALQPPGGGASGFLLVPLWMLLRMAFNAIDGMLAREHGQQTALGAYLNELCDAVSDAALYLPFAVIAPFGPWGVGAVVLAALLAEYAGVLGPLVGASRRYDGPLGKSDRALAFGALGAWVGLGGALPAWTAALMPLLAVLGLATAANRVRHGLREAAAR